MISEDDLDESECEYVPLSTNIFDDDGNAVKKLPDEKRFNLVFDNAQFKLDADVR